MYNTGGVHMGLISNTIYIYISTYILRTTLKS